MNSVVSACPVWAKADNSHEIRIAAMAISRQADCIWASPCLVGWIRASVRPERSGTDAYVCSRTRPGKEFRNSDREGAWDLVLGAWDLVLGTWDLGLGTWDLVLGTWDSGLGT